MHITNDLKSLVTIAAGLFSTLYLAVAPPANVTVTLTPNSQAATPGQFEVVDYSAAQSDAPVVPSKDDIITALRADLKLIETELSNLRAENSALKGEVERLQQAPIQGPVKANPKPLQKPVSSLPVEHFTAYDRGGNSYGVGGCGILGCSAGKSYGGKGGPIRKVDRRLKGLFGR